jgi:hypothetical protein
MSQLGQSKLIAWSEAGVGHSVDGTHVQARLCG